MLKEQRKVPKDAKWIGYRAHDFILCGEQGEKKYVNFNREQRPPSRLSRTIILRQRIE